MIKLFVDELFDAVLWGFSWGQLRDNCFLFPFNIKRYLLEKNIQDASKIKLFMFGQYQLALNIYEMV